jgi:hypothetical protein
MKKFLILLTLSLSITSLFAQEDTLKQVASKPVRFMFGTTTLVDLNTPETPYKGGLQLEIQHRFSTIQNYHNLFGIYGSANTRIGLNYGITDRIMIGAGTTKDNKLQDIQWKYLILQQTEDGKMPVSLSYYGNFVIDLRPEEAFGPTEAFRQIHRLSYFTQVIVARKINKILSVEIAPSLVYFNSVQENADSTSGYKNLNLCISAGARANVFGSHSIILEYDKLLTKQNIPVQPKPNLSLGWEISTATHTFQIFVANYNQIINQRNLVFNTNDWRESQWLVGFNIHVRF